MFGTKSTSSIDHGNTGDLITSVSLAVKLENMNTQTQSDLKSENVGLYSSE